MRKLLVSALVVLVAQGLPVGAAPSDARTLSFDYVGPGDGVTVCSEADVPNLGGTCQMEFEPDEDHVEIQVDDRLSEDVAGVVRFLGVGGPASQASFCGSATLEIPPGAWGMYIKLRASDGMLDCSGATSLPTQGVITVSLWDEPEVV